MTEANISYTTEDGHKYLIYQTDSQTPKKQLIFGIMNNLNLPHILDVSFDDVEGIKANYDITEYDSLTNVFSDVVTRDEMLSTIKNIVSSIQELEEYFITESDLLLKKEYIYIHRQTKEICFVIVAEIFDSDNAVGELIHDIIRSVQWKREENKNYLNILFEVVKKQNSTYEDICYVIDEILSKPVEYIPIEPPKPPVIPQTPAKPPKPPVIPQTPAKPPKPPVIPQTPAKPPKPPVIPQAPAKPPKPPVNQVSMLQIGDKDFDGETTVLGISNQPMIFPILIRMKNNEKVVINKMEFFIGKDPSHVDYCIFDNSAVSRVHAKIISEKGEFFVIDNRSTNHVYVNGLLIDANVPVRLSHGSRVRLGDEDFEFRFQ